MKNENNIEKNIFYRIFSFIGLGGLFQLLFPQFFSQSKTSSPEISRWQELKARAQEEISKFDKELKKIEEMDNTITESQKAIEKNEQALNTPEVPVNKKLPPLGSPVQISKDDVEKSIKRIQAANLNKDIREEMEGKKERIREMQGRQADRQEELQRKYDINIISLKSDIAYATYCIDNFHKCSYDLNKLFLQAVKTQERKVARSLLMDFEDKIDFKYTDELGRSALWYAQDNVANTHNANIPELMFNESFYNLLQEEVALRNAALKNNSGIHGLVSSDNSSEKMSSNNLMLGKKIITVDTSDTSSTNSSTGSDDDEDRRGPRR